MKDSDARVLQALRDKRSEIDALKWELAVVKQDLSIVNKRNQRLEKRIDIYQTALEDIVCNKQIMNFLDAVRRAGDALKKGLDI